MDRNLTESKKSVIDLIKTNFPDLIPTNRRVRGIGKGGQGNVFEVQKISGENKYALKISKNPLKSTDKEFLRSKKELDFLSEIRHKNIIEIIEYKIIKYSEDEYLIASLMPKFEKSLRTYISELGKINQIDEILTKINLLVDISEGLNFIHENNIIHRDIKPENILIDKNNTAVITDLGIAHFDNSALTQKNDRLVNRSYLSPEQKSESNLKVLNSTDIYSLGLIFNEVFTGKNPSGSKFRLVSDDYPCLNKLDDLISEMTLYNPNHRPEIKTVIFRLHEIYDSIQEFSEQVSYLYLDGTELGTKNEITFQIVNDLSLVFLYLQNPSKYLNSHSNFHCNIHYRISEEYQNLILIKRIEKECDDIFNYESNGTYDDALFYVNTENLENFDRLTPSENRLDSRNLLKLARKKFMACVENHQKEIIYKITSQHFKDSVYEETYGPVFCIAKYIMGNIVDQIDIKGVFDLLEIVSVDLESSLSISDYKSFAFEVKDFEDMFKSEDLVWKSFTDEVGRIAGIRVSGTSKNQFSLFIDSSLRTAFYQFLVDFTESEQSDVKYYKEDIDSLFHNNNFQNNEYEIKIEDDWNFRLILRALTENCVNFNDYKVNRR